MGTIPLFIWLVSVVSIQLTILDVMLAIKGALKPPGDNAMYHPLRGHFITSVKSNAGYMRYVNNRP
jgi:hypothetical protein